MTEIILKPELIKNLQKVLVEYEKENEDPIRAAQYLSAVVGSILATVDLTKESKDDILNQLIDFIKYVYDQQASSLSTPQENNPQNAFGKWSPK
tara:strand:- start:354 stop:635 length:282 start_codon:yes stop_codon:yes gene_type:complete